jgi:hypothetical protein
MTKRKFARLFLLLAMLLITLLLMGVTARGAQANPAVNVGTEKPVTQATPDPDGDEGNDEEDGDDKGEGEEEDQGSSTTIIREIREIFFPYETLSEAVEKSLSGMISSAVDKATGEFVPVINEIEDIVLNNQDNFFAETRRQVWRITIIIAGVLMPLALVVSVGAAMKDGTSSITGYANAREALVNWFVGIGAAIASYFLLSKGLELAIGAQRAIIDGVASSAMEHWNIGEILLGSLFNTSVYMASGPLQIFIGFFMLILLVVLVVGIAVAFLAREVLLLLIFASAPMILVAGTIGPLRWLAGLWTKITVITLLLGPANYLLLGASVLTSVKATQAGLLDGHFVGLLIALGIVSILIGINTFVGKMVFGAVVEIAQKALKATLAVGQLAAMAAGLAIGPAIGGTVGGAASAGATTIGGPTGGAGAATLAGSGGAGAAISNYGQVMSQANLTRAIGQAIASTGGPIARGFGAGMNVGGAKHAYDQLHAGDALGEPLPVPDVTGSFDLDQAVRTAQDDIIQKYAPDGASGESPSRITDPDFMNNLNRGGELVQNTFSAMDQLGVDRNKALAELGYYRQGDKLQNAASYFARANAGAYAMGVHSRTPVPPKSRVSTRYLNARAPYRVTSYDVHGAMDILVNKGVRGLGGTVPDAEFISNLSRAVYHRRTQFGQDYRTIVSSANSAAGERGLMGWMQETYNELVNKESAAELASYLHRRREDRGD